VWLTAVALAGCQPAPAAAPALSTSAPAPDIRPLTILYTNDEHGWIAAAPQDGRVVGGAAELLGRWRQVEGYSPDGPYLILSGGDMWTGPAISSWFNGDSTVEVMNLMGYRAAAIGNHEFDFGADVLRRHAQEATFPFLSANLALKGTATSPDFARPFVVLDAGGVKVGLIGLTTTATPGITNPRHFGAFDVLPYEPALQRAVPAVQAAGVDLIVVLAHVCGTEMRNLASTARALGVDVLTAGHCHERLAENAAGLPLIGGGQYMQSYARLTLDVDVTNDSVASWRAQVMDHAGPADAVTADPAVAASVARWQAQTDQALGQVIGYTTSGLGHRSNQLLNLVMDAWLWAYGAADAAVSNTGGFRQGIDAGPITLGDVVGVLPFNNQIVAVTVTGSQLLENLRCCGGAVAGIWFRPGQFVLRNGEPVGPTQTYRVLINDFMYGGGDSYKFGKQDPAGYFTAIDWRQPVIDYIKSLATSPENPLEKRLDLTIRFAP
jgi:2',3'-cyclic-nucleotide 2'-phosphodiesterase (5'-nucleotidase family)